MSTVHEVKEAVKESLVGTTIEPGLSQQARATFEKFARHSEDGESYMTEDDFVDAIAPTGEDYVGVQ
jgi:solute carrier family 25 (mitochondrial aspartate/glutamate transporter), member 12/13